MKQLLQSLKAATLGVAATSSVETTTSPMTTPLTVDFLCDELDWPAAIANWVVAVNAKSPHWTAVAHGIPIGSRIISASPADDNELNLKIVYKTNNDDTTEHVVYKSVRHLPATHVDFITADALIYAGNHWRELGVEVREYAKRYCDSRIFLDDGHVLEIGTDEDGDITDFDLTIDDVRVFGTMVNNSDYFPAVITQKLLNHVEGGIRHVITHLRKHNKFWLQREHLRKAASKGCQYQPGDFVRQVPSDSRKIFDSQETWECYKVIDTIPPEQQVLFMSSTPSYPPDMVLITQDLKKFVAYSGDYVASLRGQPTAKTQKRNRRPQQ